jgi:L-alanine-DL-glutamate epimerase-like enolase superfamily enzyme
MKIVQIAVHQVNLPMTKTCCLSGGRYYKALDSTIVGITTDEGITGWGESCPYGANYLPGYAHGVRCGIKELAPHLLEKNPVDIECLNALMDRELVGHYYLKSAIDMALWDILGKVSNLPVCELMGGRWGDGTEVQVAIAADAPEKMVKTIAAWREGGIHKFSVKISGDPKTDEIRIRKIMAAGHSADDYVFDANKGYTVANALRVMQNVRDLDFLLEQPCATYEECRAVHRKILQPMVLDECIDSLKSLLRVITDRSAEAVNIKISKVGGLTKARKIRDLCADAGILVCLQDTGGSDIVKAAIAHLAHSTPDTIRHSMWDCKDAIEIVTARGVGEIIDGKLSAPIKPGLGISIDKSVIGEPVAVYSRNNPN